MENMSRFLQFTETKDRQSGDSAACNACGYEVNTLPTFRKKMRLLNKNLLFYIVSEDKCANS